LLDGVEPQKILCITYTKAAEAEMRSRIFSTLAGWVEGSDESIAEKLEEMGRKPTSKMIAKARMLYLELLDSAIGVRVHTIHGFCQSMLSAFPIEAGLNPGFQVMDDRKSSCILKRATDIIFADDKYAEHFTIASLYLGDYGLAGYINEFLQNRLWVQSRIGEDFSTHNAQALLNLLKNAFNSTHSEAIDSFINTAKPLLRDFVKIIATDGKKTDLAACKLIEEWLNSDSKSLLKLKKALLTEKLTPRKIPTLEFRKLFPEFCSRIDDLKNQLLELYLNAEKKKIYEVNNAVFQVLQAIFAQYDNLKYEANVVDYNDLISVSHRLLTLDGGNAWVMYKMDGGIDHLLLDEAQDTSKAQWDLLEKLTEEFYAGQTARSTSRSLFVVGDEKQSIYSFQGADPQEFRTRYAEFSNKALSAGINFELINLEASRRTTQPVLKVVDSVAAACGFKNLDGSSIHHPSYRNNGGAFYLWPLFADDKEKNKEGWQLPPRLSEIESIHNKLADSIARFISSQIGKLYIPSKNRFAQPQDFMILFRSRSQAFYAMNKALQVAGISCSGLDRLNLRTSLAVMDLLALAKFITSPEDDYNLACVLKSVFVDLTENELMDTLSNRDDKPLLTQLCNPEIKEKTAFLRSLLLKPAMHSPYEFYNEILVKYGFRAKFIAIMGDYINDVLDEFLEQAISYEANNNPSLYAFVNYIETDVSSIKRDLEQAQRSVRIMTVHASKGLESPIVIIPDANSKPILKDKLIKIENPESEFCFYSLARNDEISEIEPLISNAKSKMVAEYNRQLYVALTRARDYTIVCGTGKESKEDTFPSWYKTIRLALTGITDGDGICVKPVKSRFLSEIGIDSDIIKVGFSTTAVPPLDNIANQTSPAKESELSPDIVSNNFALNMPLQTFSASNSLRDDVVGGAAKEIGRKNAKQYGVMVHKLLQYLPDIAEHNRLDSALNYLKSISLDVESIDEIISESLAVLSRSELEYIFHGNGYSEVPIAGFVNNQNIVGQIDRLIFEDSGIIIIDYKTDRTVPNSAAEVAGGYIMQMNSYRQIMQKMYPDKIIKTQLLYTGKCKVVEL